MLKKRKILRCALNSIQENLMWDLVDHPIWDGIFSVYFIRTVDLMGVILALLTTIFMKYALYQGRRVSDNIPPWA